MVWKSCGSAPFAFEVDGVFSLLVRVLRAHTDTPTIMPTELPAATRKHSRHFGTRRQASPLTLGREPAMHPAWCARRHSSPHSTYQNILKKLAMHLGWCVKQRVQRIRSNRNMILKREQAIAVGTSACHTQQGNSGKATRNSPAALQTADHLPGTAT